LLLSLSYLDANFRQIENLILDTDPNINLHDNVYYRLFIIQYYIELTN